MYRFQITNREIPILTLLKKFPEGLTMKNMQFKLDDEIKAEFDKQEMWSMLIDDRSGNVLWSYRLPKEIPVQYSLSDVAAFSRYYLKDYPVSTWEHADGLLVVGSPRNSFWKSAYMVPYSEFNILQGFVIIVILCDLLVLFLFYLYIDRRSLIAVSNILSGIQSLASGKLIDLNEKGPFSDVANQLNKTSDLLKRRTTAQENWLLGISHDIRTPLTVILGYAESIETNPSLPNDVQQKASLIKYQSIALRDLVNDLNLITSLEDSVKLKPIHKVQPLIFGRDILAQFLNSGIPDTFPIKLSFDESLESIKVSADIHLLQRAINNVLYNCIKHNPGGCNITFKISNEKEYVLFCVSDDGKGMTSEEITTLKTRSKYLSNSNLFNQKKHGFGLYIVQQIVKIHAGNTDFKRNQMGGLDVVIAIPKTCNSSQQRNSHNI
ncbi:HAMP domain-containing sensor histidine kinase [Chryseobacterium sp. H1D6B]|uniref:sensor histidine kinase n=1 Tax=Chryseobacterium sp. H1D6B TaxID=2940588 RepID=UPI0015CA67D4|nr:HAMP domain-containing sensor histidine kinase [Chryseobacterium sp. H1D6B]